MLDRMMNILNARSLLSWGIAILWCAYLTAIYLFPFVLVRYILFDKLDIMSFEIVVYISAVFFAVFVAFFIPHLIRQRSKAMQISEEVFVFVLCEIAVLAPLITFISLFNLPLNLKITYLDDPVIYANFIFFAAFFFYNLVLWSIRNTLTHSIWIYHLIRGTERKVIEHSAMFKAFHGIIGHIMLYGSIYNTFIANDFKFSILILMAQIELAYCCKLFFGFQSGREEAKAIKKFIGVLSKFLYFMVVVVIPLLLSIVIISTKYDICAIFSKLITQFNINNDCKTTSSLAMTMTVILWHELHFLEIIIDPDQNDEQPLDEPIEEHNDLALAA